MHTMYSMVTAERAGGEKSFLAVILASMIIVIKLYLRGAGTEQT